MPDKTIEVVALHNIDAANYAKKHGMTAQNKALRPAIAMRIQGGELGGCNYMPFKTEPYKQVFEYVFDDRDPAEDCPNMAETNGINFIKKVGFIPFGKDLATIILNDFRTWQERDVRLVVVHCYMGRRRSPAVAMALNKVFRLGNPGMDPHTPCREYQGYNRFVYKTMMAVAKEMPIQKK
jgi:hypothetical protein